MRALTGCRDPDKECEQGLELPEAWWGMEPTDGGILPSLPATEYDSAAERERRKGIKVQQLIVGYILSGQMLQTDFCTKMFNFLC